MRFFSLPLNVLALWWFHSTLWLFRVATVFRQWHEYSLHSKCVSFAYWRVHLKTNELHYWTFFVELKNQHNFVWIPMYRVTGGCAVLIFVSAEFWRLKQLSNFRKILHKVDGNTLIYWARGLGSFGSFSTLRSTAIASSVCIVWHNVFWWCVML